MIQQKKRLVKYELWSAICAFVAGSGIITTWPQPPLKASRILRSQYNHAAYHIEVTAKFVIQAMKDALIQSLKPSIKGKFIHSRRAFFSGNKKVDNSVRLNGE